MKKFIIFLLLTSLINADEELFELESFNFSMENDRFAYTDFGYSHGARTSLLFFRGDTTDSLLNIPFTSSQNSNNFISFSYAQQMFTPYDLNGSEIIKDDRPYAGYSYIEIALHQTTDKNLDSLTLQTGLVGPSSGMEKLQTFYHEKIDAAEANGWQNQLKDKFIMQLNYMHKWRFEYSKVYGLDNILIPYSGINLGNASIKASAGAQYRIGFNIPKDFGVNSMNEGSYSSLPIESKAIVNDPSKWALVFNLSAGSNLVARDIFLDDWYEVERNYFNAYMSAGVTARYKNFSVDYQFNYYTKDYEQRDLYKEYKGYGFMILTYSFE